jgi:hypothetical protein
VGTAALSKQKVYAPVTQPVNIEVLPPCPVLSPGAVEFLQALQLRNWFSEMMDLVDFFRS